MPHCLGPEFLEIFLEIWGQASPTEISKRFGRLAAFRRLAKFSRNFRRSNSEDQPAAGGIFLKEVLAFTFSLHFWVSATSPLSPFCVRSQIDGVKSKLSVNKSPRGTRTSKSQLRGHQSVPAPAVPREIYTHGRHAPASRVTNTRWPLRRWPVRCIAITSHPVLGCIIRPTQLLHKTSQMNFPKPHKTPLPNAKSWPKSSTKPHEVRGRAWRTSRTTGQRVRRLQRSAL